MNQDHEFVLIVHYARSATANGRAFKDGTWTSTVAQCVELWIMVYGRSILASNDKLRATCNDRWSCRHLH
jgi:hypothetical protein